MDLVDTLRDLSVSKRRSLRDDDFFVDRLHHRYTVAMLVLFCAVVTTNQYAGEPINCWVPAQFTGSFETYTNRLCWLQNTYYVEDSHDIPDDMSERSRAMLKYYQWVHLIILLQSVLFIIPRIIWRSLNDKCGIEIVNFVDAAIKYETVDEFKNREKLVEFLRGHIESFIHAKDSYKSCRSGFEYRMKKFISYFLFWTGKRFGNYLIILYTFVKILYLVNVVGQLFLMTRLLGISNYYLLGFEILHRMAFGLDMIKNHYFPKVTHCDFKIRELGNDHQYTVQCVLSINIFTEKIYIILWFWFVILSVITFFDLFVFLFKFCFPSQRYFYVRKHVLIFSSLDDNDKLPKSSSKATAAAPATSNNKKPLLHSEVQMLNAFANKHLKPDIVLVLKIIAANVNGLVVSELVKELWDAYLRNPPFRVDKKEDDCVQETDYGEYDEQEEDAGAFPIHRQPIEEPTTSVAKQINGDGNNASYKRSLGLRPSASNSTNNDNQQQNNDAAKAIIRAATGDLQTGNTPVSMV